jgi:hypothetical protein
MFRNGRDSQTSSQRGEDHGQAPAARAKADTADPRFSLSEQLPSCRIRAGMPPLQTPVAIAYTLHPLVSRKRSAILQKALRLSAEKLVDL